MKLKRLKAENRAMREVIRQTLRELFKYGGVSLATRHWMESLVR